MKQAAFFPQAAGRRVLPSRLKDPLKLSPVFLRQLMEFEVKPLKAWTQKKRG